MARNMVLTYLHLLDPGIPIEGSNKTSTKQGKKNMKVASIFSGCDMMSWKMVAMGNPNTRDIPSGKLT